MAILMQNEQIIGGGRAMPEYTFDTVAEMDAAVQAGTVPPNDALIFCKEDLPMGNTGDTSLDTTSENWVQNQAVATEVISQQETMRANGAHNLLNLVSLQELKRINASSGTWDGNVYTISNENFTYTVNDDLSITIAGTLNGTMWFFLTDGTNLSGCEGMVLSGNPYDVSKIGLTIKDNTGTITPSILEQQGDGEDVIISSSSSSLSDVRVAIRIFAPVSNVNITIKPMIRQASDTDKTYAPYAMTNRELTSHLPHDLLINGTTDSNARIATGLSANDYVVIGANGGFIVNTVVISSEIYLYVLNPNGTPATNAVITARIFYIKR